MLDLSQVLCNVEGTTLEGFVSGSIVHLPVPVEEVHLSQLDYLHGDIEGDGHDYLEYREMGGRRDGEGGREVREGK